MNKNNLTELEKYQRVNSCETLEEIQKCIEDFADEEGNIQGRTRKFNAKNMSIAAFQYYNDLAAPNVVTREFGLRQQLMYIKYYK